MRALFSGGVMGVNPDGSSVCDYCGKDSEATAEALGIKAHSFWIGAKRDEDPGFTMVEGTGKMACAACYPTAKEEGREAIRRATGL